MARVCMKITKRILGEDSSDHTPFPLSTTIVLDTFILLDSNIQPIHLHRNYTCMHIHILIVYSKYLKLTWKILSCRPFEATFLPPPPFSPLQNHIADGNKYFGIFPDKNLPAPPPQNEMVAP